MKKQGKLNIMNMVIALVFIIGFMILIYPMISAVYYDYDASQDIDTFNKEVESIEAKEINKRIEQAQAYNASLSYDETLQDFYTEKELEVGKHMYAQMLEVNEMIGTIEIPSIHQELPVYAGTNEEVLQKGIGHLERTSLPVGGNNTNTVLTGHRGLPNKKLFTDLPKVKIGDMIYFKNIKEIIAYKVYDIKTVLPHQTEVLNLQEDKDLMTLITCTPYMVNSHRLIVTAERVPYTPEIETLHEEEQSPWWYRFLKVYKYYVIGIGITLLLWIIYKITRKRRQGYE
ncbi:class C sortase [Phocicoccus pinnipedialis]|uniref:Sortase A n=1 Tax=Phocicoccus pinnipedialis TaxID=110845 RepID=A0A6V7R575_9BACL|nr:class C sortase [Jeotgalicoccus pinnipedialis]MBP1940020.1 sortase A [Jeotgalicoccus pinnipedialis]CAD2072032.1 Sortase A [Jeotgalicoccus pinnipedialis]